MNSESPTSETEGASLPPRELRIKYPGKDKDTGYSTSERMASSSSSRLDSERLSPNTLKSLGDLHNRLKELKSTLLDTMDYANDKSGRGRAILQETICTVEDVCSQLPDCNTSWSSRSQPSDSSRWSTAREEASPPELRDIAIEVNNSIEGGSVSSAESSGGSGKTQFEAQTLTNPSDRKFQKPCLTRHSWSQAKYKESKWPLPSARSSDRRVKIKGDELNLETGACSKNPKASKALKVERSRKRKSRKLLQSINAEERRSGEKSGNTTASSESNSTEESRMRSRQHSRFSASSSCYASTQQGYPLHPGQISYHTDASSTTPSDASLSQQYPFDRRIIQPQSRYSIVNWQTGREPTNYLVRSDYSYAPQMQYATMTPIGVRTRIGYPVAARTSGVPVTPMVINAFEQGQAVKRRKYCCRYCPKSFHQKWNLTAHERIHTGERPYVCEVCDKGFAQLSNMKRHRRTHDIQPDNNQ